MTYPFQSSYPFGLPDSLPFLFNGGEEGAIYDPSNLSSLYQDAAATTAVAAYGDPVGRIRDVRATETFTATYTSDFSAGVDGWAATNGTAAGNIDGVAGQDNWLRLTVGSSGGVTRLAKNTSLTAGKNTRIVLQVYVPSGQTEIDGFSVLGQLTQSLYVGTGENGSISSVDVTDYIASGVSTLNVLATDNGANPTAAASGDLIYVRAVVISETDLNDAIQSTSGSRPLYARMPKTGIRNLLTDTATLATQNYATTNVAHTLSFYGTGSVTLSGTSTDGPLVGTGANDRVTLTFTPSAGTLTLTVSGSVTSAQLEIGSSATAYQLVGTTRRDISESGIEDVFSKFYDSSDDFLTLGVGEVGTGLFADGTAEPNGFAVFGAFKPGASAGTTILARAGATTTSRTFHLFLNATTGVLSSFVRGTLTNFSTGDLRNSNTFHVFCVVYNAGAGMNLYFDSLSPQAVSVGVAAEETSENILIGARTSGTPAGFFDGDIANIGIIERSLSDIEISYVMRYLAGKTGASL